MDTDNFSELRESSNCLLLGTDLTLIQELRSYMQGLQISSAICLDPIAFPRMLNHGRYEGIVVDCHLGDDAFVAIENARLSPSNRRSVILAITGSGEHVKKAFLAGANFTLDAPLSPDSVQQLLKAAHQIMQNERRKYTRRACCVSASLERPAQPPCHCQTLNVAEGGICVLTDHPQPLNDNVTISFHLPGDSIEIRADCQVCWRDEQGRVGLEFLFMTMQCKEHLQKWLQRTGAAD